MTRTATPRHAGENSEMETRKEKTEQESERERGIEATETQRERKLTLYSNN